jgi:hypothetical protein
MSRPSRRAFLAGAVGVALLPAHARAGGGRYAAAVRPARAMLGERVLAVLTVTAGDSAEVLTFDDPSLMVKLRRGRAEGESSLAFPNHWAEQRGKLLIRKATTRKPQRLKVGQHLERDVDLIQMFPSIALTTGHLEFAYEIGDAPRVSKTAPARLTIESGPDAVASLFGLLADANLAVREDAALLLHRMTAHVAGYDPGADAPLRQAAVARWQHWWETIGRALPWSFTTSGAVLDGTRVAPPPARRRSRFVGGVRYDKHRLGAADAQALAGTLTTWVRDAPHAVGSLAGKSLVADRVLVYPPETSIVDPGDEAAAALEAAVRCLAGLATPGSAERPEAAPLLATVARMPQARFVDSLSELETHTTNNPGWRGSATIVQELLEVLGNDSP